MRLNGVFQVAEERKETRRSVALGREGVFWGAAGNSGRALEPQRHIVVELEQEEKRRGD